MKFKRSALLLSVLLVAATRDTAAQTHFSQCASATGSNASVIIEPAIAPTIDGAAFSSGDEIAVFGPTGICAGVESWTGSTIALTVWADDPFTTEIDGMTANETMRFVLWDKSAGKEVGIASGSSVSVGFDPNPPYRGSASFAADAIYRLTSLTGTGAPANVAPRASFSATPRSGTSPLSVTFNASGSSDSDGTIVSYNWTFGDGGSGSGVSQQHTYSNPGTYSARLTVRDDDGGTATATTTITVSASNNAPTASAQATPVSGTAPLTVSFNSTGSSDSDGTIVSYAWNFGDGSTANGQSIQHLYSSAGTYSARLTVTDDDGAIATDDVQIVVAAPNQPPVASFVANPTTGAAPLVVTLNANQSVDPDGSIATYSWNYGDGTSGTGKNSSHTFTTPGTYVVALTVRDDAGASASTSVSVSVSGSGNSAPVAALQASPLSGTAPLVVSFSGSGSSDSDGTISSYAWDFGDGSSGTGVSTQHTYSSPGSYNATLTIRDDDGATGSAAATIVVTSQQNVAPTALFTATPTTGVAPLLVSVDASTSTDSDGTIVSYSWSYGDGSIGSGQSAAHTFNTPGSYTIQLTVTDDDGATHIRRTTITVNEGVNEQPAANFTATPLTGSAPLLVSMDASTSTDPDGTIVSYAWNFGDGVNGTGVTATHTYSTPGTYNLRLEVVDDGGARSFAVATVTVSGSGNQAPVASFTAGPTSGNAPLLVTTSANASSDPDGSIVSYEWNFGDGIRGTGRNASHTYLNAGTFNLTLTVTDNDGSIATSSTTISVNGSGNLSPLASFSATPVSGNAPLPVSFDASGSSDPDGSISSYSWSFGDGINGSGMKPSHTYTSPGNYTVTLTIRDDQGGVATSTTLIQVTSDIGAQSDLVLRLALDTASGNTLSDESGKGQQATLMNGATFDPVGGVEGGGIILDGVNDYVDVADDISLNQGDIIKRTISVWFNVDDSFGASHKQVVYEQGGTTRGLAIYIFNGSLFVGGWNDVASESNWPGTFLETGSIQSGKWHHVALVLDGSSTTVQPNSLKGYLDGALFGSGDGARIWGHDDDIGIGAVDGNSRFRDGAVLAGANGFKGRIDEIRIYDKVLTDSEIQNLASFSGQSPNQVPTAQFSFNPQTAQAPANISFDASGSQDADGTIVNYGWDFGDSQTGSGRTASHRFDTPGTYTIELSVTDNDGATGTQTASLTVTASSGNSAPLASFTATPVADQPRTVRFDASASSDPDGVVDQFIWDFGDSEAQIGEVVTHEYSSGGAYTVKLTIVDNRGATAVSQQTVEIESSLPQLLQPATIGPLADAGSVSFADDQWTLSVRGRQWDPRLDAMLFVHRPAVNGIEVSVRVDSIAVEDSLIYTGVTVRSGLSPTDANASVAVRGQNRVVFSYRAAQDGWEVQSAADDITLPIWVRIARKGTDVQGAYSTDGEIWTTLAEQNLPIDDGVFGGLMARSSDPNRIASVTMSDFKVALDDDVRIDVPNDFILSNAFPNPFQSSTTVTLSLSQQEDIVAGVYDIAGRRVATLQDGPLAPNIVHRIVFDGNRLASGVYLIRVQGDSFITTRKVVLIK
ncbi:MAG: PKD domain-containing protein [Rhodothermales bacterium]